MASEVLSPTLEEMIKEALNRLSEEGFIPGKTILRDLIRKVLRDGDEALMLAEGPSTLKELAAGFVERAARIVDLEAALRTVEKERDALAELIECDPGDGQDACGTCRGCLTAKLHWSREQTRALAEALRLLMPRYEHLCSVLVIRDSTWAIHEQAHTALAAFDGDGEK